MKERTEENKTVFVSEPSVRNVAFWIIYYTAPLSGVNSWNVPRNDTFINNTNYQLLNYNTAGYTWAMPEALQVGLRVICF